MNNSAFIRVLLIASLLMICACTKKTVTLQTHENTENIWQAYLQNAQSDFSPFLTQMSLRYGVEGDTRRVTALLWGNDAQALRLDVNAGVGVNIAKLFEDDKTFLAFITREGKAYYHEGEQKPLFNAGVPIPFNLQQLTQIIEGNYSAVFGTEHANQFEAAHDDNSDLPAVSFTLKNSQFDGSLTINSQGLPILWQEESKQGWSLSLGYRENANVPYKLSMFHTGTSKMAILLIKERSTNPTPFTNEQMRLILPKNTVILPFEQTEI